MGVATKSASTVKGRRAPTPERLPETTGAIDIALAAVNSGKPLPDIARRVLEEQTRLLHAQVAELKLRHVGEGVRAVLWGVLAIAAAIIVALLVSLVIRAARTDALVVQSFGVPPGMAAKGLSGEVVATHVLDKLAAMQAASESTRAASSYDNNWQNDLKIDIPNTGATFDQVWKLLRNWLGKETRISGEVVESKSGLALTARVGVKPGQQFVSATGDLDALVGQTAELIYRETQPYRYAVYLGELPGREADRGTVLQELTVNPSPTERKWAYNGLAYTARQNGDFRGSIAFAGRALAIDPDMIPAMGNVGNAEVLLGHDQSVVDAFERTLKLPVGKEYDSEIVRGNACVQNAGIANILFDPVRAEGAGDCYDSMSGSFAGYGPSARAFASLIRHDATTALAFRPPARLGTTPDEAAASAAYFRLSVEMERGPGPALTQALADYTNAIERMSTVGRDAAYFRASMPTQTWPTQADSLLKLGRLAEAAAMIARTPLGCYSCLVIRGKVAASRGDPMEAQRWFKEAVRQGPRLPLAYLEWGRLLAAHGKTIAAEARFDEAAKFAPNWADPLKYRADLFAARGKTTQAVKDYDAATRRAPNWQDLRIARARLIKA